LSYVNTFIAVASDTKATSGTVPPERVSAPTVARIEYELISRHPYGFTQDEVRFLVHAQRTGIAQPDLDTNRESLWTAFFAKPRACMRTSPLPRTYGWGLHFNTDGHVALVACDSTEYQRLSEDSRITQTQAMRNTRT
jgi:hypothetical protein